MNNTSTETQQNTQAQVKPDFGGGKYSALMAEVYKDAQLLFGLSAIQAEKLARQVASELGAFFATANNAQVKIGSISKDGKFKSIKEASSIKNLPATKALTILKALQFSNDAFKNGVNRIATKWQLIEPLQEYVDDLAQ